MARYKFYIVLYCMLNARYSHLYFWQSLYTRCVSVWLRQLTLFHPAQQPIFTQRSQSAE